MDLQLTIDDLRVEPRRKRGRAATAVAQSCTLPYRRFSIGKAGGGFKLLGLSKRPQNAILRYGRLKICATANRQSAIGNRQFGLASLA
jgi:hypothetical protein